MSSSKSWDLLAKMAVVGWSVRLEVGRSDDCVVGVVDGASSDGACGEESVGARTGDTVGSADLVGESVGAKATGASVLGEALGSRVGRREGCVVGGFLGRSVGRALGLFVGLGVGRLVGVIVGGLDVGSSVGVTVGDRVGALVGIGLVGRLVGGFTDTQRPVLGLMGVGGNSHFKPLSQHRSPTHGSFNEQGWPFWRGFG